MGKPGKEVGNSEGNSDGKAVGKAVGNPVGHCAAAEGWFLGNSLIK